MSISYGRYVSVAELAQEHRNDDSRDTSDYPDDDLNCRRTTRSKLGLYTPGTRYRRQALVGWFDVSAIYNELVETGDPKVVEPGTVTQSVNYPYKALNGRLHQWYERHGRPTGDSVYRSQDDQSLDGFILSSDQSNGESEDSGDDEPGMWDDVDRDWVDYMRIRDSKTKDPETVHDEQTGLRDFRSARQADVNPDSISQVDDRLDSLPAFLDDSEYEEVSKYTPGTGGPLVCDHCNSENWWSHPLESGIDALRPGGIEHGDPECDPCHADEIKGCSCHACPRCSGLSIEFRVNSQDYRCNNCDLRFGHPVPAPSKFDGERGKLYWRCKHCGMATQAPFVGVPKELLDAAPQAVFDTDD